MLSSVQAFICRFLCIKGGKVVNFGLVPTNQSSMFRVSYVVLKIIRWRSPSGYAWRSKQFS
uniref:Uncharacterized protein n=1 Tax=Arundo donax TaxID=35708 RepID=A0A0A9F5H9_ARUDO